MGENKVKVVGVRFKKAGKIYYFDPAELEIKLHDKVIVETARGLEYGEVVVAPKWVDEEDVVSPLKNVVRLATEEDSVQICLNKIAEHQLPMKLVDVEYTFDVSKIIFYFTAEGRVDFRELVKDLAAIFKTRIELRQIGVRDEAKMLGGLGSCGRVLCCASFLGDFEPVSIRMAKEQNLSLNPSKISGICGRLMCCLKYENDNYEELRKNAIEVGEFVNTPLGPGKVIYASLLREKVTVELENDRIEEFNVSEVARILSKEEDKQ
jgi:cell fate regulator YaaT (PSP1 superfamily)